GELHIMPPASFPRNRLIRLIQKTLDRRLSNDFDLTWDTGFLISERPRLRYRVPDLAVIERNAAREFRMRQTKQDPYARFAPVLVIEVLSPSNRKGDLAQLLVDYRDLKTAEALVIDPEAERGTLFARADGELKMLSESSNGMVTAAGVPIDLDEIWREFHSLT
ncbi:MAG: Uma2 family endonuclease, partial [Acidobacteriota bacterium]|nr:Uma2 family endonuclease [Acidobacteriota bacterium]